MISAIHLLVIHRYLHSLWFQWTEIVLFLFCFFKLSRLLFHMLFKLSSRLEKKKMRRFFNFLYVFSGTVCIFLPRAKTEQLYSDSAPHKLCIHRNPLRTAATRYVVLFCFIYLYIYVLWMCIMIIGEKERLGWFTRTEFSNPARSRTIPRSVSVDGVFTLTAFSQFVCGGVFDIQVHRPRPSSRRDADSWVVSRVSCT